MATDQPNDSVSSTAVMVFDPNNDPISSTATAVEAAKSEYKRVEQDSSLGKTFHAAGDGLSAITSVLDKVKHNIPQDVPQAVTDSLKSCFDTAALLKTIFEQIANKPAEERKQVYLAFVRDNGRHNLVEVLVIGVMELVHKIAMDRNIEAVDLGKALTALKNLRDKHPSDSVSQNGAWHFENHGDGNQFNAPGGTQNNSLGPAPQFVGGQFQTVNFGAFANANGNTQS